MKNKSGLIQKAGLVLISTIILSGCAKQKEPVRPQPKPLIETIRAIPDSAITLSRADLRKAAPLSAKGLKSVIGNAPVVFFSEWHDESAKRDALTRMAGELKAAGIRQLVLGDMDADQQPLVVQFNKTGRLPWALVDTILQYQVRGESDKEACRMQDSFMAFMAAMHKAGIRLIAGGYSGEHYAQDGRKGGLDAYRPVADSVLAKNIKKRLRQGRTAVLVGERHVEGTSKWLRGYGFQSVSIRLSCKDEKLRYNDLQTPFGLRNEKNRRMYRAYSEAFDETKYAQPIIWPVPNRFKIDFPFDGVIYNPTQTPDSFYQNWIREIWPGTSGSGKEGKGQSG